MQELKITMLGPRGVGKTSLLTAMYEQFESTIGRTNLELSPDEESSAILQERLIELKSLLDDFEAMGGVQATEAPAGPDSLRSFKFGIAKKAQNPSLELNFCDYPGGYIAAKASTEEKQFVKQLLTECTAVILTIDAPALMEADGKWHELINRPQQMRDLFKTAYRELDSPRLVILAPVKCEKYLQDDKLKLQLVQQLKKGYANLLDYFSSENLLTLITVVVTPVQTVGSVVFSRIEFNQSRPIFRFRKISHTAEYAPQDSEQPLRYLLRFVLKLHLDTRKWGFFNFLREWLGFDNYLKAAVKEFASGCKNSGEFAVLQGEKWIN